MFEITPSWVSAYFEGSRKNKLMQIGINLYRRSDDDVRQGLQFDLGCIVTRLFRDFPEIVFEEEYYRKHLAAVERIAKDMPPNRAPAIAARDAEERGPAFSFRVAAPSGSPLRGGVSRYTISFRLDADVAPELRKKAEAFIDSFCLPRFQEE